MDQIQAQSSTLEGDLQPIPLSKDFARRRSPEHLVIRDLVDEAEKHGINDNFQGMHPIGLNEASTTPLTAIESSLPENKPNFWRQLKQNPKVPPKQSFLRRMFIPRLRNRSPVRYVVPKRSASYSRPSKHVSQPGKQLKAWGEEQEEQEERSQSDKLLAMTTTKHLHNRPIGRAPPLSRNTSHRKVVEMTVVVPLRRQTLDGKEINGNDMDIEGMLSNDKESEWDLSSESVSRGLSIGNDDETSSIYTSISHEDTAFPDDSHVNYDDPRHSTLSGESDVVVDNGTSLAAEYIDIVQEISEKFESQCHMRGGAIDELEGETYLGDEDHPSSTVLQRTFKFLHERSDQRFLDRFVQSPARPTSSVHEELEDGDDSLADPFEYERYRHLLRRSGVSVEEMPDISVAEKQSHQHYQTLPHKPLAEVHSPVLFPPTLPTYTKNNPVNRLDEGDPYPEDTSFDDAAKWHGLELKHEASGPTINPTLLTPSSSHAKSKSFTTSCKSPSSPLVSVFSNLTKAFKRGPRLPVPSLPTPDERTRLEMENRLTVAPRSEQKTKAVEDARKMQAYVVEECKKSGKDPPPFGLEELIGKGSFGRVYKGKDMTTAKVVAIKIVDIDESDTLNPKNSDAYSEFLKEVNALKLLGENKAKNINLVLEALPVGKAMWMITEHCGGGSVATLMKPTLPNGLLEKWVRTILREAAEGLFWVHQVGIIHRDIKSANVLVTENGDVQLCDFGVAGIIENKTDKRSTIIGTPHWMAPELLTDDRAASYGKEIDIWAFGAMAYEMASGLPPSASIPMSQLQTYLKQNSPRLPEGTYSDDLRDIVAICLQNNPQARPTIEDVQKHRYIYNTSDSYPTGNLRALIHSYRKWESDGGTRKSLFWQHGAQAPVMISATEEDDWNFSVTDDFDDKLSNDFQGMANAYKFPNDDTGKTARPAQQGGRPSRRRPPPEALSRGLSIGPLEKLFDPNTLTSYNDNIVARYGKQSDLPLRDDSTDTSIRDTMIDLGGHDVDTGVSSFSDMDTIRADRRGRDESSDVLSTLQDFGRPALSDPADNKDHRRTQDWKFPSAAAPPASADPEVSRFPMTYEIPRPTVTPGSGDRPPLIHHPTEPLGSFAFGGGSNSSAIPGMDRMSTRESLIDLDMSQRISMRESLIDLDMAQRASMRESLIDLDMSMPDPIPAFRPIPELRSIPEFQRPSTANSDVGSTTSEQMTSANPFELERHPSLYLPVQNGREPSIYVSDDSMLPQSFQNGNALHDLGDMSDFSGASDAESYANDRYVAGQDREEINSYYEDMQFRGRVQASDAPDNDERMLPPPRPLQPHPLRTSSRLAMPNLPEPPSATISTGRADPAEVQAQLTKSIGDITAALQGFRNIYDSQDALQRTGSDMRKERRDPPPPRS